MQFEMPKLAQKETELYPLIKHDTSAHGAETKTSGRLVIRSSAASA